MGRWIPLVAIGMAWIAACVAPDAGPDAGALADRTLCPFAYPDGTPVDCARDLSVEVPPFALPAGWVCLDRWDDPDQVGHAELWSDLAGRFALEYDEVEDADRKFYGKAVVADREVLFWGPNTGTLRFEGPLPDRGEWSIVVDAFDARGEPEALNTRFLRMHATEYEQAPWYVWAFSREASTFFFDSMEPGPGRWAPRGFSALGDDFEVTATVTTPVEGGGSYVAQASSARGDC